MEEVLAELVHWLLPWVWDSAPAFDTGSRPAPRTPAPRRSGPKLPGKVLPSGLVLRLGAGTQCPVCKDPLKKNLIACPRCMTPQHRECWVYAGGCSTYACRTRRSKAIRLAPPLDPPAPAWEEAAPDRPPLHTHPALQAPVAALVLGLIVALGYGLTEATPRFTGPPKNDNYRPVMVSARWTPPHREDVWHQGLRPYQPSAQAPTFYGELGLNVHNPALPSHVDRWGRPIVPAPRGRPSVQDPEGWPGRPSPWTSQPGYQPYGPTPPQRRGFGPSPVPPWNHRR